MTDEIIHCAEAGCTQTRTVSESQMEWFAAKGFSKPKYCVEHSAIKRKEAEQRKAEHNSPFKPALDATRKRERGNSRYRGDGNEFNDED